MLFKNLTGSNLTTLINPIPDLNSPLAQIFFAENEVTLHRLMRIVGITGLLAVIVVIPIQVWAMRHEAFGLILMLGLINACAFLFLSTYKWLGVNLSTHTIFLAVLLVVFTNSGIANVIANQALVSFIFITLTNSFIATVPWPVRPTRIMIILSIAIYFIVTVAADSSQLPTALVWIINLAIILSGSVAILFHSFMLYQRWQIFLTLKQNEELANQLMEKTADLEEINVTLQEKNAELDAFAHTVAHDLKNPLGAIIGYSEMLQEEIEAEEIPTAELANMAGTVTKLGIKTVNIINELLMLSSVDRQAIETESLNMGEIVTAALQRLDLPIQDIKPKIIWPDIWPQAIGYGPWIEEVWANYLSNGLKYGGRPCQIEIGGDLIKEGQVRFWVRDNGAGLTAEQQAKLFAEFSRLPETRAKGHGLGLSIVKRIMQKLNGHVGVESKVGHGSLFFFTLPAVPPNESNL